MKIIGLTGGIGAGKSLVSRALRVMGQPVYDCDLEARRIMDQTVEIREALRQRFGAEVDLPDGGLNRKLIAASIFADQEAREWLNALVHRAVQRDIEAGIERSRREGAERFVFETAILYSSQLDSLCDEIWLVDAPRELRIERALRRGGIDRADLERRIEVQVSEFEELKGRVRIIHNDGRSSLLSQIEVLMAGSEQD